jgi:ubiquinone/menaquinone biosynthesis C-methylase UbiE
MEPQSYFKALADVTRLRLLHILLHFELRVNELVSLMEMGQSRISRHLKILTDAGLLECRRDGSWAFYFAAKDGPGRRFLDSVKYLFDHERLFQQDLIGAEHIVRDRSLETVRFFNQIASKWDLLKSEILGDFDLNEAILGEVRTCDSVVDLGCGTGELMEKLKTVAHRVIGVDSSSRMLEIARERLNKEEGDYDLRLGELEHLPLKNHEADCAVISMVLHHLSKPDSVIAEICRILREKGRLVIVDFDKHEDEDMRIIYGDRWLGFSREEIEDILNLHGLRIEQVHSFQIQKQLTLNLFASSRS